METSKQKRSSGILSFSDEIMLRVFKNLDVVQLVQCQTVSRRFYSLASDNHLWKEAYARIFGSSDNNGSHPCRLTRCPCRFNVPSHGFKKAVSWQYLFKVRDKWSRGDCQVHEVHITGSRPGQCSLVRSYDDLVVTAEREEGLRIWLVRNHEVILKAKGILLTDDVLSRITPTCMALSRSRHSPSSLWIALGFDNGLVCIHLYDATCQKLTFRGDTERLAEDEITSLDLKYPYLTFVTKNQSLSVVHISAVDRLAGYLQHASTNKILTRFEGNMAWSPANVTIHTECNCIRLSIAYTAPLYMTGWIVGVQEIYVNPEGGLLRTRTVTTDWSDAHPSITRNNSQLSPGILGQREARPTKLSYRYPFLLVARSDNSLELHKIRSTDSELVLEATQCLWGHTSFVKELYVSHRGKVVTSDIKGSDVRVWDLETCISKSYTAPRNLYGTAIQPSPKESRERFGTKDFVDTANAFSNGWASNTTWIGLSDDRLLFLRENVRGEETLTIYDFT